MAALKKPKEINLIPLDKFSTGLLGRTLNWLLKTFRVIVMVVEMIVMIAFLSRFWLDAKNSDLTDELKQKSALIEAQADFEEEFLNAQKRIDVYSQITKGQISRLELTKTITSTLPPEVFLTSISFTDNGVDLLGSSLLERSVSQFIVNLENTEGLGRVELKQVGPGREDEEIIEFSLNISLSEENKNEK